MLKLFIEDFMEIFVDPTRLATLGLGFISLKFDVQKRV
jgi:hypothetical protein